jgi:nitroimidazol reductase NimA-like FMN-containing flavoprotein (pyridoxamine 5'-phosphate oxidase superfamily)
LHVGALGDGGVAWAMASAPKSPTDVHRRGEAHDAAEQLAPTTRTTLRRLAERGTHQWSVVEAILDEGFVCHVAFCAEGQPFVLPMAYGRRGRVLYLHGAPANHLLRGLGEGLEACVTVTLVDGLVLSRSQFHHSINYRSVVIYGRPETVEDPAERRLALTSVVDQVVPGRSADARPPTDSELRATRVVKLGLEEASAKVRTGPPKEEPEDLALPVFGGEVPLRTTAVAARADGCGEQVPVPSYLEPYTRPGWPRA